MNIGTQTLLRESIRELLASRPESVDDALFEMGWQDATREEPAIAQRILFEEQGEMLVASNALDAIARSAFGLAQDGNVIWPHPRDGSHASSRLLPGRQVSIQGLTLQPPTAGLSTLPLVIGNVTRVVQASAELSAQPVGGTGSSWWLVTGVADQVNLIEGDWHEAVDTARYALAAELMGVCRRALSTAVEHVRIRSQFGRPIGSYQSVRHRLAEAHAQLTGTESLLTSVGNDLDHWSAATVKSMAGFTHTSVVRHCLQVCGAMGLSEEHLLPRCVRRGHLIDLMLGSAGAIARDQGAELLLGREPPLITVI